MKAYKARITNSPQTLDGGSVWVEILVFAKDFVGATMETEKAVEKLADELKAAGCPTLSHATLEVDSLEAQCEVVNGFGFLASSEQGEETKVEFWAKTVARKIRKDMDA